MLRKLIGHELRATSRTMGPMLGLVLLTAVGGNVAVYNMTAPASALLRTLGVILLAAFVVAMLSVGIVTVAQMIRRFYKNLLRDEGYLMMTLPVSVHKQIAAKVFVAVLWFIATGVVMALALAILALRIELIQTIIEAIPDALRSLKIIWADIEMESRLLMLCLAGYLPVILVLSCASLCLNCYAAMAIGHSFSSHKGLWSFAAYFGMAALWQMLGSIASWGMEATGAGAWLSGALSRMPQTTEVHVVMIGAIAVLLLNAAALHAITAYFLQNKLNLE